MTPHDNRFSRTRIVLALVPALLFANLSGVSRNAKALEQLHFTPAHPMPEWPLWFWAPGVSELGVWMEENEILIEASGRPVDPAWHSGALADLAPLPAGRYFVRDVLATEPLAVIEIGAWFRRGDANADGVLDASDAVTLLDYLFGAASELPCMDAADANDSGDLGLSDAVYLLTFLFVGGAPPEPPREECGFDPTPDDVPCRSYPGCVDAACDANGFPSWLLDRVAGSTPLSLPGCH